MSREALTADADLVQIAWTCPHCDEEDEADSNIFGVEMECSHCEELVIVQG